MSCSSMGGRCGVLGVLPACRAASCPLCCISCPASQAQELSAQVWRCLDHVCLSRGEQRRPRAGPKPCFAVMQQSSSPASTLASSMPGLRPASPRKLRPKALGRCYDMVTHLQGSGHSPPGWLLVRPAPPSHAVPLPAQQPLRPLLLPVELEAQPCQH